MAERNYWLVKSEPGAYSWDDLCGEEDRTAEWDGVRNYQARNLLRDRMKVGDGVLFYHSNAKPMSVVGTAVVVREGRKAHGHQHRGGADDAAKRFSGRLSPISPACGCHVHPNCF